jgi:hypothetical protein
MADFERLKNSKEHEGFLMPIMLNQDNVVLGGHHRMRTRKELGFPVTATSSTSRTNPWKNCDTSLLWIYTGEIWTSFKKKAEIGLEMEKLVRNLAEEGKKATLYLGDRQGSHKQVVPRWWWWGRGWWWWGPRLTTITISLAIRSVSADTHGMKDGKVEGEEQGGKPRPFTSETARDAANK